LATEEDETRTPLETVGDGGRASAGVAPREGTGARGGPFAEPWLLAACLCVVAAAVCLVLGFYDAAFVAAAVGAVAWFLNVRSQLPRPPDEEETDEHLAAEDDDAEG
jgi:hypothetical protein